MKSHRKAVKSHTNRSERQILIVILIVALSCLVMSQLEVTNSPLRHARGQIVGVLLDKDTSEETAYSLEILSNYDIESDFIKNWADTKKTQGEKNGKAVYYTLYNDEYDAPLEMYMYMPLAKEVIGDIGLENIKVNESGKALVLNINTDSDISHIKDGSDMIFHIFVTGESEAANAKTDRLIVNGEPFYCAGATFTRLK